MPDVIYMTPRAANEGIIYMEPREPDVIYMYKEEPLPEALYEWRTIGVYTFSGNRCSPSWNGTAGDYTGAQQLLVTEATNVRLVARSGSWWDGVHYRGMMDVKTSVKYQHMGYDWTGTFFGFVAAGNAAGYWLTVSGEIEIGADKIFAWGGYDLTPADNTGGLTFSLIGKFNK